MKISFKKISYICFTYILVLVVNNAWAQVETVTFDDGTKIPVEIVDKGPDGGRNTALYFGGLGIGGIKLVGFDYYKPTKYFFSAMAGPNNYMVDGNYFFANFTKDITLSQSVEGGPNSGIKYVLRFPAKKRSSLGAHLCLNHLNQINNPEASFNWGWFKLTEVNPGISWLSAKNSKLKMSETNIRQGSSYKRINLDAIFYSSRSIDIESYTRVSYKFTDTGSHTIVTTKSVDDVLNKIGYRFYIDGKATDWGKGRFSYKYTIGVQSSPLKEDGLTPKMMAGVGVGYSFRTGKKD